MEKYTKLLCLKGVVFAISILWLVLICPLQAEESLRFKGGYFLFSDDLKYIYGSKGIVLQSGNLTITGDVLYMDVKQLSGVIYGKITIKEGKIKNNLSPQKEKQNWHGVYFKAFPLKLLKVQYTDTLIMKGDKTLERSFASFVKKAPEILKNTTLFFEFREFRINKNGKIKSKIVIPYMMGLPTVPLRRFTVNRGKWADKTMLSFNNVNYSAIDGLSLSFFLRLREKFVKGDYDLKLFERKLFKLGDPKRGILFSGNLNFFPNARQKELFAIYTLLNSGEKSFNFRFSHKVDSKFFRYTLSQTISGRKDLPTFQEFRSDLTLKKLNYVQPKVDFSHNLKKSYSYRFSTPLNLMKKLHLNVSWQRKIIKDNYESDTADFATSMSFNASLFSLSSNYNFSKNLLAAEVRKNFSVNMKMKPLYFLEKNMAIDMATFYMFSSLPYEDQTRSRISPGVNVALRSIGASLPLGFKLVPSFRLNHLWDNREESFTDFNYSLGLRKDIGNFATSIEYALASRYRAENFWIEGNNRQNLQLNFLLEDKYRRNYSFLLRFYHNNDFALENISFTGKLNLPYDLSFSSFLLYYSQEKKFQTLEVFIQKTFKKKIKIQGGYSLALKRFFIKFLTQ
jgi:hypothetical protein